MIPYWVSSRPNFRFLQILPNSFKLVGIALWSSIQAFARLILVQVRDDQTVPEVSSSIQQGEKALLVALNRILPKKENIESRLPISSRS